GDLLVALAKSKPRRQIDEHQRILLHRQQRHAMGGRIGKPVAMLHAADGIGERAASRHQDIARRAAAALDRREPGTERAGGGEAAAELHDRGHARSPGGARRYSMVTPTLSASG